jgi:hypothetical protein
MKSLTTFVKRHTLVSGSLCSPDADYHKGSCSGVRRPSSRTYGAAQPIVTPRA